MDGSILTIIKKKLGIDEYDECFDVDVISHINTWLMALWQMGVGTKGFIIYNKDQTWKEFVGEEYEYLTMVVDYVYAKVKLVFDPPQSAAAVEALEKLAAEAEFRLHIEVD